MTSNPPRRAYRVREVAAMLDLTYKTILREIHAGRIKATRFGEHWRIPDHEVDRLLHADNGDAA